MLTVIRELAEAAEARAGARAAPSCSRALVERGEEAVARTPEQLDVLREAGVVDAGGAGLVELVRGLAAAAAGESRSPSRAARRGARRSRPCTRSSRATATAPPSWSRASGSTRRRWRPSSSGSATRCSSSATATALKVHVHTDDPGAALSLGTRVGTIEGVEIADMHRQTEQREERLLAALPGGASRAGVVAVVAGEGNRRLFEDLGAEQDRRGRPDDEPVDGRPARGGRGDRARTRSCCCRTTRTSCWPPSRPRASRASRCRSSRPSRSPPAWRRSSPSTASARPRRTRRRCARRCAGVATGEVDGRLARRSSRRRRRCARASTSALLDGEAVAAGAELRRGRARAARAPARRAARRAHAPHGRGRAAAERPARRARRSSTRSSSSTCTRAASRTTRCCSPPSSLEQ